MISLARCHWNLQFKSCKRWTCEQCSHLAAYQRNGRRSCHLLLLLTHFFARGSPFGNPDLHIPEGTPSSVADSIMAGHIDAFRTGRPFSELTIFCNFNPRMSRGKILLAYSNGFLSWCDSLFREVRVLELKTSITKAWVNQDRVQPMGLAISEKLLAVFTCNDRVYIYNHLTGDEYRIGLPSGYKRINFFIRGGTLAMMHGSHITTVCSYRYRYIFCSMRSIYPETCY